MAVLSDADRRLVWDSFMVAGHSSPAQLKAALRAGVDAADDWIETNAASFNTALPVAFRTNHTAAQKAILLAFVCLRRAGINL